MEKIKNQETKKYNLDEFYVIIENIKNILKDDSKNYNQIYEYFKNNKWYFKSNKLMFEITIKQYKNELKNYINLSKEKLVLNSLQIMEEISKTKKDLHKSILKLEAIF